MLDKLYTEYPQLKKINENIMNHISLKKFSIELNYDITFGDNGFDDLDCVEFLMEIENKLDISIHDEVADYLFNTKSKPQISLQYLRNKKI